MTETLGRTDFVSSLRRLAHRVGRVIGKLGFGLVVVVALGIALLATTFIGVLIAVGALFLSLTRKRPASTEARGQGGTLEARQTADGWVIESGAGGWR